MEDIFEARCLLLQQNRQAAKRAWFWAGSLIQLCCANVYTLRDRQTDAEALRRCKQLVKDRVSVFSCLRGNVECVLAARMDLSGHPEETLQETLDAYAALRQRFHASGYLPLGALSMSELSSPARFEELAGHARDLYDRMRQTHPILTASEDAPLCVLLALSDKHADLLLDDVEACYQQLKPSFPLCGDSVQTLSLVLALMPGSSAEKSQRVMALFDALKRQGRKWGTTHELSVLGILALQGRDPEALAADILTCDQLLARQKGFGPFSISSRQRLMYAGLMAQPVLDVPAASGVAIGSALSALLAEQAATIGVTAAIGASAAASSASS